MIMNEKIIDKQLSAYNSRNINDFLSYYSSDVEIYNFRENTPFIKGIEGLRDVYSEVFDNSPNIQASIKNRIIFDNKVIDEEEVTGRKGIDFIKVVVIYEIENDLINRVTFVRKK